MIEPRRRDYELNVREWLHWSISLIESSKVCVVHDVMAMTIPLLVPYQNDAW